MTKSGPFHGDGVEYSGECLCHGVVVTGTVARSRPGPYMTNEDPFGSKQVRCVLLSTSTGAHDVPVASIQRGKR